MLTKKNKVIIYAQDCFNLDKAKTGIGFIKYGLCETVGIVDRKLAGKTASEVISFLPPIPIFESIESAKKQKQEADSLLIGIALGGGKFPDEWLPDIKKAINLKLNIVNGLHDFLGDIKELNELAKKQNIFIWDVRKYTQKHLLANAKLLEYPLQIILTVGTDGAIGKMTTTLELTKAANKKNLKSAFVATGQTGIMISGRGIPIDAITGDFMAGAIEQELIQVARENYKIAFVEGQGSILHPGWSGVTLALLHGSLPHKLILCHKANREFLKNTNVKIESLNQFINLYESITLPLRMAKVAGIALNTFGLTLQEANDAIKKAEDETSLPTDDPIRNSGEKLLCSLV